MNKLAVLAVVWAEMRKRIKEWLGILCIVVGICLLATSVLVMQKQIKDYFRFSGAWATAPANASQYRRFQDRIPLYRTRVFEENNELVTEVEEVSVAADGTEEVEEID